MKTYEVMMTKTIVVHVEANSIEDAKDKASLQPQFGDDPDGEWARAQPELEVIGVRA